MVNLNSSLVKKRTSRPKPKAFKFPESVTCRDRPLSFHWSASYDELNDQIGLPLCASKKMQRAMASIVVDVILTGPNARISYSRTDQFYRDPGRYRATDYGYETVVGAVDRLLMAGLLVEHHKKEFVPGVTGWQSSFKGAPALYQLAELPAIERRPGELIRLKDEKTKRLVEYTDTRRTVADRKFVEAINARIRNAVITLNAPSIVEQNPHLIRFRADDDHAEYAAYPHLNQLYRVYNGGWTLGGRFYGGWWQNVRAEDRVHFHINGEPTVEPDYEELHPRLLYAHAGEPFVEKAYDIAGWDRKLCKRAFNILLNAPTFYKAVGKIAQFTGCNGSARSLVEAIKCKHFRVRKLFHSGIGVRLQNIDAELAKTVLNEMTLRRGIVVLPIHDSFIVQASFAELLRTVMADALAQVSATQLKGVKTAAFIEDVEERLEVPSLVNEGQYLEGKSSQTRYRGVGGGGCLPDAPFSVGDGSISALSSPPVCVTVRGCVEALDRPARSLRPVSSSPATGLCDSACPPEVPISAVNGSITVPRPCPVGVAVRDSVAGVDRSNPSSPYVSSPPVSDVTSRPSSDQLRRFFTYDEFDDLIPY